MSSVVGHDGGVLKRVLAEMPPGFLVDSKWLDRHGVSRQLAHYYVGQGWLERVERGLYRRPPVGAVQPAVGADWIVPVLSAAWLGYDLHLGGPTALALSGHTHYLPLGGKEIVYMYSDAPPKWLKRLPLQSELRLRSRRLFDAAAPGLERNAAGSSDTSMLSALWEHPLMMSTPERAILEALDELPENEGFGTLDAVFQGLSGLRPRLLTQLLASCRSIKVKRMFFVFADRHAHAWRRHLDPQEFDLGAGDRAFIRGGRLHPDYRIVVPAEFVGGEEAEIGA